VPWRRSSSSRSSISKVSRVRRPGTRPAARAASTATRARPPLRVQGRDQGREDPSRHWVGDWSSTTTATSLSASWSRRSRSGTKCRKLGTATPVATTRAHPLVSPASENSLTTSYVEPPVGIEPTTFSLREVRLLVRGCPYNALSGVFDLSVTRVDPPVTPRWLPRWLPQLSTMDAASPLPQTVSLPRRNCSAHAVRRSPRRQLVGRRTTRGVSAALENWTVSAVKSEHSTIGV